MPQNPQYFQKTIDCYQQYSNMGVAEKAILARLNTYKQGNLLIELGYNFQLQKNEASAKKQYDEAIEKSRKIQTRCTEFQILSKENLLIEYALKAYQTALKIEPQFNFNYQMALLYGQLGKTEMMISTFLDEAYANPQNSIQIQINWLVLWSKTVMKTSTIPCENH